MSNPNPVRIYTVGMSVGILLSFSFALCVLPGVRWISWPSALLGLVESFAYGWYIAVVFVPTWNFFSRRALA